MKNQSALRIIEETYDMALNPDEDFYAQLAVLAPNGELANHNSSLKVLFKLCNLIDSQAKTIKALEEKMIAKDPVIEYKINPTQPLDEQTTFTGKQDTHSAV